MIRSSLDGDLLVLLDPTRMLKLGRTRSRQVAVTPEDSASAKRLDEVPVVVADRGGVFKSERDDVGDEVDLVVSDHGDDCFLESESRPGSGRCRYR